MKSDEDDPAGRYERKTVNAVNETKAAIVGTARGLWASLPGWVRGAAEAILGFLLVYIVLVYIVFGFIAFVLEAIE